MSGSTPNAKNHGQLPPLASRFVDVEALPWEKTGFPGVEGKTLVRRGRVPGRPVRLAGAGSQHEAWGGPQGGVMLAIFQVPNKFFQPDGRETDQLGNDYEKARGAALRGNSGRQPALTRRGQRR